MLRLLLLLLFSALSAGCVPVTEPVGDIDKAAPDKGLVGEWTVTKRNYAGLPVLELIFDAPDVKGNPKGLMRCRTSREDSGKWFYPATVGKRTYGTTISHNSGRENESFNKEGVFAAWQKGQGRLYGIFRYVRDGDTLTVDHGSEEVLTGVMRRANIEAKGEFIPIYQTPMGWLEKLVPAEADKIFDDTETLELVRKKK